MAKKSKNMPQTDGESDMDAPGMKRGGKAKKNKREQQVVRGEKSRIRLDKKKR